MCLFVVRLIETDGRGCVFVVRLSEMDGGGCVFFVLLSELGGRVCLFVVRLSGRHMSLYSIAVFHNQYIHNNISVF